MPVFSRRLLPPLLPPLPLISPSFLLLTPVCVHDQSPTHLRMRLAFLLGLPSNCDSSLPSVCASVSPSLKRSGQDSSSFLYSSSPQDEGRVGFATSVGSATAAPPLPPPGPLPS